MTTAISAQSRRVLRKRRGGAACARWWSAPRAASVISDNYWGAQQLTLNLLRTAHGSDIVFIGGIARNFNATERARAFKETVMAQTGLTPAPDQINICGYSPEEGEAAIRRIHARLGRLPSAILVNATISFEGVFRFLKELPDATFEHTALGCYDRDPFLSHLHFPVSMVRQNAKAMVEQAFGLLDSGDPGKAVRMIRPDLLFALMDDMGGFGQRSCSLHNPAAVIACTDPEVFKMDRLSIDEVETGEQVGRTGRSQNDAAPSIAVCVDGDMEADRARFAVAFDQI